MKPRSIPTADDTVIRHVQIADGICRFSLFDWARANGVKPANAVFSLRGLLKRIPTLGEHVEAVGVLAWLYWRENNGRLPWALFDGRAYV